MQLCSMILHYHPMPAAPQNEFNQHFRLIALNVNPKAAAQTFLPFAMTSAKHVIRSVLCL